MKRMKVMKGNEGNEGNEGLHEGIIAKLVRQISHDQNGFELQKNKIYQTLNLI